jgi:phosphoribosylformylglycinamidine synthase
LEKEQQRQSEILAAIRSGLVSSAHDLSEGGLSIALAECLMGTNGLGVKVQIKGEPVTNLFSETQSRYLLSVKKEHQSKVEAMIEGCVLIGEVNDSAALAIFSEDEELIKADVKELETVWKGAIPCLLK